MSVFLCGEQFVSYASAMTIYRSCPLGIYGAVKASLPPLMLLVASRLQTCVVASEPTLVLTTPHYLLPSPSLWTPLLSSHAGTPDRGAARLVTCWLKGPAATASTRASSRRCKAGPMMLAARRDRRCCERGRWVLRAGVASSAANRSSELPEVQTDDTIATGRHRHCCKRMTQRRGNC